MKKHFLLVLAVLLVAALLLPACSSTEAPEPTETTPVTSEPTTEPEAPVETKTLKFSYSMPKGASMALGFEWWGPEFEKRTEGRYKVEIYPGSSLVSLPAALDAAKEGIAEVVMTSTGMFPKDFPLSQVTQLPTLGFPGKKYEWYQAGFEAVWELLDRFPEMQAEYNDVVMLWPFELDPYYLVSKSKEVHKAEDFNGMKVGAAGYLGDLVKANGGAAVHQVPPQSYMNLDKGVTDAAFNTFAQVKDYNLFEIVDYFYMQDFGSGCINIFMHPGTYNAMSAEDQKILMDSWYDSALGETSRGMIENNDAGVKLLEEMGMPIAYPTAEETEAWSVAAQASIDAWKADCIEAGLKAETVDAVLAAWKEIRAAKYAEYGIE